MSIPRLSDALVVRNAFSPVQREPKFFPDDGRTQQNMRDECDVNLIVARFAKAGLLDHLEKYGGQYGDLSGYDFHHCQNVIADATAAFESLPAAIRKRFGNDPGDFLAFAEDEENEAEMRKLGLLPPAEPLEDAPVASEPAEPAVASPPPEGDQAAS